MFEKYMAIYNTCTVSIKGYMKIFKAAYFKAYLPGLKFYSSNK